jgi:murein DD-endopeptidase MepM/ murein hydrolase activator NlpD
MIASFPPHIFKAGSSIVEKYLFLNKELRKENHRFLQELCQSSTEEKLWDGPWLRMKNAATMANFGDKRVYYYKGNLVDEAVHLGIDLASLARSPVEASNSGRVVFAQDLGIYGNTVVIDHGQGLHTMYGHLSTLEVTVGQLVTKGETIGTSGTTGLATGDHLHFGFLVHGVPVNPIEWWDDHWMRDNVEGKLSMVEKYNEGQKGS